MPATTATMSNDGRRAFSERWRSLEMSVLRKIRFISTL